MFASKAIAVGSCLIGLLACWLMWHEAGLPPKDRAMHLFGPSGGTWIMNNPYPESCIAFSAGVCIITILGVFGLIGRDGRSPEWHWSPAFIATGVILILFLHEARRVNGTDMAILQPGHVLGLMAASGVAAAGVVAIVHTRRNPR